MVLTGVAVAGAATTSALGVGAGGHPFGPLTPRAAAETWVAASQRGDRAAMWDLLCPQLRTTREPPAWRLEYLVRQMDGPAIDYAAFDLVATSAVPPSDGGGFAMLIRHDETGSVITPGWRIRWAGNGFRVC